MLKIKEIFKAKVESGNIRYQGWPAGIVALTDDALWVELFVAGAGPVVDFWLCGWIAGITQAGVGIVNNTDLVDIGYGGADGGAPVNAPAVTVVTNFPVVIMAVASGLGPTEAPTYVLPYPVRIPGGSRMVARIASSPTAGIAIAEFRVILATVVGR